MTKPAILFDSSRQKVARAQYHLKELEARVEAYFKGNWYSQEYGGDPYDVKHISLTVFGQPADFSVIFGDVIHNLRAALDIMAVEVVAKSAPGTSGVCFPFCEREEDLEEMIKRRNFHRAPQKAIEALRSFKPYNGGNTALRALHDLDIQDKHRALVPVLSRITTSPIGILLDENGHPVGFSEKQLKMRIDLSIPPTAEFVFPDDSAFAQQLIIPTLHEFVTLVSSILDAFEVAIS